MTDSTPEKSPLGFADLGLGEAVLKSLEALGFETPTPIQELAIPLIIEGRDIIGQAQTGTGKTAAFALPLLEKIDISVASPQMLVMAPTRELALQVCDATKDYARNLRGLHILPVYGGQGMVHQLRALRKGVHVVVGTPGRLIDHLERGTLKLDNVKALVLDEADEMLRMGFVEEVEKILEAVPDERQTALFSATMPPRIRQIAKRFLNDPAEVKTKSKESTVESIRQFFIPVTGERNKIEAMTRLLQTENFDGMIVFVRTKAGTVELAETMESRGFTSLALNGDMNQQLRQRTVERFKRGGADVLICTDVAARGLDVPRITHVLNYDIPYDTEVYVHRIGRTGRAGREGTAILFAGYREKRMLHAIERATRKNIERMSLPTGADMGARRIEEFKNVITEIRNEVELEKYQDIITAYCEDSEADPFSVAAALTFLAQQNRPFDVPDMDIEDRDRGRGRDSRDRDRGRGREPRGRGRDRFEDRGEFRGRGHDIRRDRFSEDRPPRRGRDQHDESRSRREPEPKPKARKFEENRREHRPAKDEGRSEGRTHSTPAHKMKLYRVAVGREHGMSPNHLVGAITNEAGLDRSHIGAIRVSDDHATVELPAGMPPEVLSHMKKVWACGAQLDMELAEGRAERPRRSRPPKKGAASRVMGKQAKKKKPKKPPRPKRAPKK